METQFDKSKNNKGEITTEFITQIRASYLGSDFAMILNSGEYKVEKLEIGMLPLFNKQDYLILNSLLNIKDEDAITVANLFGLVNAKISERNKDYILMIDDTYEVQISYNGYICVRKNKSLYNQMVLCAYQYLQSKGYALPFGIYSISDLVKLNVYKLK